MSGNYLGKKLKLSKKLMGSDDWRENYKILDKREGVEDDLGHHYKARRDAIEKAAIEDIYKNPDAFYRYAKKYNKDISGIGDLKDGNNLTSDNVTKANLLQNQYKSMWSEPRLVYQSEEMEEFFGECIKCNTEDVHICKYDNIADHIVRFREIILKYESSNDTISYKDPKIIDICANHEDFIKAINKLSPSSACGEDGISSKLIKRLRESLAIILSKIFQKSMDMGKFPSLLKNAIIIGIFKGGDKTEPSNYRPIALTSHLSKLMERVVRKRLVDFLDTNGLWDRTQHGSRSGHSTLSQLLDHQDYILSTIEEGHNIDVVYLDFAKAYDKVDHSVLLHKI